MMENWLNSVKNASVNQRWQVHGQSFMRWNETHKLPLRNNVVTFGR